jgi:hypothetical protein
MFPRALHADLLVLDQPVGALVRAVDAKRIRGGIHRSTRALEDAIRLYLAEHNANPLVWAETQTTSSTALLASLDELLGEDTSQL